VKAVPVANNSIPLCEYTNVILFQRIQGRVTRPLQITKRGVTAHVFGQLSIEALAGKMISSFFAENLWRLVSNSDSYTYSVYGDTKSQSIQQKLLYWRMGISTGLSYLRNQIQNKNHAGYES